MLWSSLTFLPLQFWITNFTAQFKASSKKIANIKLMFFAFKNAIDSIHPKMSRRIFHTEPERLFYVRVTRQGKKIDETFRFNLNRFTVCVRTLNCSYEKRKKLRNMQNSKCWSLNAYSTCKHLILRSRLNDRLNDRFSFHRSEVDKLFFVQNLSL